MSRMIPERAPKHLTFVMANMYFAQCKGVHDFIGEVVRPLVDRHTNALPWTQIANALLVRVHANLRSLGKLDHPGDSQLVQAGARSIFETAIDLTLLQYEERGSFAKLIFWQDSSKLHWAKRRLRYLGAAEEHAHMREFIEREGARIEEGRRQFWGRDDKHGRTPKKVGHQPRWTGRTLEADADRADDLNPAGFVEYYNMQYTQACWQTHGSGVIGLLEMPAYMMPFFAARGFYDAAHFGVIVAKLVLQLFGQYDEIAERRFRHLEYELALDSLNVCQQHQVEL